MGFGAGLRCNDGDVRLSPTELVELVGRLDRLERDNRSLARRVSHLEAVAVGGSGKGSPIGYPCPFCKAGANEVCVTVGGSKPGSRNTYHHAARYGVWRSSRRG